MNKPYITFSGTASVGKTTLVKVLLPELERMYGEKVVYITEVARSLEKRGFKINKDATSDTQRLIEAEYKRLDEENKNSVCVADRSIIDRFSYATLNGGTTIDEAKVELINWYDKNVVEYCKKYSHIFYIPLTDEVKLELDGIRSADEEYRRQIDIIQKGIIGKYKINVVTLQGTIQQRVDTVLAELKKSNATFIRNTN